MRAVATALVLIAGAAVILWYGSTLNNSWVLGGLIGGLAALLLSIPISLTLFSHFSRRHDEHLRAEEQEEEIHFARERDEYDYPMISSRRAYEVEGEGYSIQEVDEDDYDEEDDEEYWREEEMRRRPRRLPAPESDVPRTNQRQTTTRQTTNTRNGNNRLPAPRPQEYLPQPRQQMQQAQQIPQPMQSQKPQRRDTKVLRNSSLGAISQHRMDALRAARMEAARASEDDDIEVSQTQRSRQERNVRSGQYMRDRTEQESQNVLHRASERPSNASRTSKGGGSDSLAPQREKSRPYSDDGNRQSAPPTSPYSDTMRTSRENRREPQTDYISNRFPRTEPVRRARTKDLQPNQEPEEPDTSDIMHVNRPLVRRAPYLYEDDDLRQQFAHEIEQMDPPRVRRSSRLEDEDA